MVCINCKKHTRVINSRAQRRSNRVWRRRQCIECKLVFSTEESIQYENVWVVTDSSGSYSPFSRDKLLLSLYRSCQYRQTALNDAAALSETIIHRLQPVVVGGSISSKTILQVSQVVLSRFDRAASINYEAHHSPKNRS